MSEQLTILRTDDDGTEAAGWDGYAVAYAFVAPVDADDLAEAIDLARAALLPANPQQLIDALAALRYQVRRPPGTADDHAAQLVVYVDGLLRRSFPADVVEGVVKDWDSSFWPDLAELMLAIERRATPRRALLRALERGYVPKPEPDWTPPTDDEKRQVDELLAKHGICGSRRRGRPREQQHARRLSPEQQRQMAAELARVREHMAAVPLPGLSTSPSDVATP